MRTATAESPMRAGARRRWRPPKKQHATSPERISVPLDEVPKVIARMPSVRGDEEAGVAPLTFATRYLFTWMASALLSGPRTYRIWPMKELAEETGMCRRTVIRAVEELRKRKLIRTWQTRDREGRPSRYCYRLTKSVLAHFQMSPLRPEGTEETPAEVEKVEKRKRRPASPDLNGFAGALARTMEQTHCRMGATCRWTVAFVGRSLPPQWHSAALSLARWLCTPSAAGIVRPGAFLRARLADAIREAGDRLPVSWGGRVPEYRGDGLAKIVDKGGPKLRPEEARAGTGEAAEGAGAIVDHGEAAEGGPPADPPIAAAAGGERPSIMELLKRVGVEAMPSGPPTTPEGRRALIRKHWKT